MITIKWALMPSCRCAPVRVLIIIVSVSLLLLSCIIDPDNPDNSAILIYEPVYTGTPRSFESSFETDSDFNDFYIVPPGDYDSNHKLSDEQVYDGSFAHKAWILQARADNNDGSVYLPHRAYPTVQLQKTVDGIYRTPSLIRLWVYLDITLEDKPDGSIDDWFSFITLTPDASDYWSRTVLVNIAPDDNYVRLVHVPNQGEQEWIFQANASANPDLVFPYNKWVRLDVLIDFDDTSGYAKVWQDGDLVSHAYVNGGVGGLAQAHFGMYASAAISSGTIYNDKLRIKEIADRTVVADLVADASW